jgi:glycosyltransferase involved in cell wall biosynthesis
MKICLVSQEYPPETGGGGIGTQTYLKAQGLTARGHEVHVVSASWDGMARTYRDGAAVIHRIAEPRPALPAYEPSTYWLMYSVAVAEALDRLSRHVGFDIIQFPEYGGEGFVYQTDTFRYRKARYVVQLHGSLAIFAEHMGWPERGSTLHEIGCFMERAVIHHADAVLSSSCATAAFCAERYGYPLERIDVIHSGIDTARFHPRPAPDDRRHPRILFVGNLVQSKGILLLARAVLALRWRYPGIVLRAIGKDEGRLAGELTRLFAAAGAAASLELGGYVPYDALPEQYAWCDFFAGPSSYEPGPGNVYLEAMACARPVIAGAAGGAPEVVLAGETGLLLPPDDGGALEKAIAMLADDAELRRRLGRLARAWVAANFSLDAYIDKVERAYADTLGGGLCPPSDPPPGIAPAEPAPEQRRGGGERRMLQ